MSKYSSGKDLRIKLVVINRIHEKIMEFLTLRIINNIIRFLVNRRSCVYLGLNKMQWPSKSPIAPS